MPTILIVDDDEVDREQATRCLPPLEALKLLYARNGSEALEVIADARPDLVLTDLRMSGMDGLELVARVREEHPLIPVILMTSRGSEQIAVKALKSGAASYVPKSAMKEELAETIEQVMEITEAGRSRQAVLRYLDASETRFDLVTDPALISPLVGYLTENLSRLGFGNESIRTQVGMALMEALSNAMIHGNLEVSSDLRDGSTRSYYQMIEQRRGEEPYAHRRVRCIAREAVGRIDYVIHDDGPGFDPASLPDPSSGEGMMRVRGRGLLLIRTFMDSVQHNAKGNEITMRKSASGRRSEAT